MKQTHYAMGAEDYHDNHGNTLAAWVVAAAFLVAAVMASLGFVLLMWPLAYAAIGVAVLGLAAGITAGKVKAAKTARDQDRRAA